MSITCPFCKAQFSKPSYLIQFDCPNCKHELWVMRGQNRQDRLTKNTLGPSVAIHVEDHSPKPG